MNLTTAAWVIGGVSLPALVIALVQFFKIQLNLDGVAVRWLAFVIGFSLGMLMLSAQYLGGLYGLIVTWVIVCLEFGLSGVTAMGLYDAVKQASGNKRSEGSK